MILTKQQKIVLYQIILAIMATSIYSTITKVKILVSLAVNIAITFGIAYSNVLQMLILRVSTQLFVNDIKIEV
jgi:asparagine N-glycosylation enzyme membrane subunit Stt3